MKKIFSVLTTLVIVFSLVGCIEKSGGSSSAYGPAADDQSDVVATINNTKITAKMLNKRAMEMSTMYGEFYAQPEGKLEVLDQMVSDQLLMLEVTKRGLDRDPQIAEELRQYKEQLDEQYERYKEHLLKGKLVEAMVPQDHAISDEEAEQYFHDNPGEFEEGAKVTARHILVKTKAEADDITAKLDKGEDFADLASASSLDEPTAKSGGQLGELSKGMMYPEIDKVLFSLKVGEVKPVELKTGFYKGMYSIIRVDKIMEGKSYTFAEIKDRVKDTMTQNAIREQYLAFVKDLESKAQVQTYPEKISATTGYNHPPMTGEQVDANSVPNDATHRDIKTSQSSEKMSADATHGNVGKASGEKPNDATHGNAGSSGSGH